jgi:hypothetical protein
MKNVESKQYNGIGIEIPYTIYQIKVVDVLKGEIESNKVDITYFGGYEEDFLHVVNRNSNILHDCIPIEGEYYIIIANKENDLKDNGRIRASSYIVSSSENIIHLDLSNESKIRSNKDVKKYVAEILSINETIVTDSPYLVIDAGGGGEASGNSFSDAIELSEGINMFSYLSSGIEKYYMFYSDSIEGVVIQSTYTSSQLDVKAYLYNNYYTLIAYDFDSGDYQNFLIDYQVSSGMYYYLKVSAQIEGTSGSYYVKFEVNSDCTCTNSPTNLVLGYSSVNVNRNIIWNGSTQYDYEWNYSVEQWNDEDFVLIKKDTWLLDATLNIDDYEDTSLGASIAYFQNKILTNDIIRINTHYFDNMTSQQRFKTMMHELGHALGINEMNTSGNSKISSNESNLNVMVQGIRATTQIGPCDRNVYRYLWK